MDIFFRGPDQSLFHSWYDSAWGAAPEAHGGIFTSPLSSACWSQGYLEVDVFGRGAQNSLFQRHWDQTKGWVAYKDVGGLLIGGPSCVSPTPGKIICYVTGLGNNIHATTFDAASNQWTGFPALTGSVAKSDPNCVRMGSSTYCGYVSLDGMLAIMSPDGGKVPDPPSAEMSVRPALVAPDDKTLLVIARTTAGTKVFALMQGQWITFDVEVDFVYPPNAIARGGNIDLFTISENKEPLWYKLDIAH